MLCLFKFQRRKNRKINHNVHSNIKGILVIL